MKVFGLSRIAALALVLALSAAPASSQTAVKSGFNVFTAQQDIDLGRQSASQIERQLPMVSRPVVTRYISQIGARLAQQAPGERYPYQFKVVNLSDINAFALPGGFIYSSRSHRAGAVGGRAGGRHGP